MKLSLVLAVALLVASFAQASVVKSLRCENGELKATVEVQGEVGSAAFVQWTILNKATSEIRMGSGYMLGGLKNFSSSDVFESIEVEDQVLTISNDGQNEVLSCQ